MCSSDLTVGWAAVDFEEWADPAARPDFSKAIETIRSLGVKMAATSLPDFPYGPAISTIISSEGSAAFEPLILSGKVDQLADQRQIAGLKAGLEITAKDYLKAMRIRRLIQEGFRSVFANVDLLLTPARLSPAPPLSPPLDRPLTGDRRMPEDRGLTNLIPAGNLAGLPAISLPCGFADGLPIGISLVGPPFSENLLLQIGKAFQSKTDWHQRRPPV